MRSQFLSMLGLLGVLLCLLGCEAAVLKERHPLLLLSFDGFRWDYLNHEYREKYHLDLSNFDRLKERGVYSKSGNIPPHYTQTFPSHYTTATGLYIESHGIVANSFFDPKLNATFKRSNTSAAWWDQGEPIWITAKKNHLKSATFFWPGSEVNFHGIVPDHQMMYDESVPFETRIDTAVQWLEDGIDLVVSYF